MRSIDCLARRAAERSAYLIDEVLPVVPIRQWVMSLPMNVRYMMLFDHELTLAVLKVVADSILGYYRDQAKTQGIPDGFTGMVSAIQRFGGHLNANIHFHSNLLDGTFSWSPDGTLSFHEAPMPKQTTSFPRKREYHSALFRHPNESARAAQISRFARLRS